MSPPSMPYKLSHKLQDHDNESISCCRPVCSCRDLPAPSTSQLQALQTAGCCDRGWASPTPAICTLTSTSMVLALSSIEVTSCEFLVKHSSEPQFPQMSLDLWSALPATYPPTCLFPRSRSPLSRALQGQICWANPKDSELLKE